MVREFLLLSIAYLLGSTTMGLTIIALIWCLRWHGRRELHPADHWLSGELDRLDDDPEADGDAYVEVMHRFGQLLYFHNQ